MAYVSCSGGILYYRPCPANLVWDDYQKLCGYTSRTCRECAIPVSAKTIANTAPDTLHQIQIKSKLLMNE